MTGAEDVLSRSEMKCLRAVVRENERGCARVLVISCYGFGKAADCLENRRDNRRIFCARNGRDTRRRGELARKSAGPANPASEEQVFEFARESADRKILRFGWTDER
jgi:hypothetical protein